MSRIQGKHSRASERRRRNNGPELLSKAADNELKYKAEQLAEGLSRATIDQGNVAAAGLLVRLAESAYQDDPAAFQQVLALIEKWEKEPQVVALDTDSQIEGGVPQRRLTDGSAAASAVQEDSRPDAEAGKAPQESTTPAAGKLATNGKGVGAEDAEIIDGEYEMEPATLGGPPR